MSINAPKTGEFKFEAGKQLKNLAEADSLPFLQFQQLLLVLPMLQNPSCVWDVRKRQLLKMISCMFALDVK